jgi:phosphate starvation-inducible protein PhoH and related proteins
VWRFLFCLFCLFLFVFVCFVEIFFWFLFMLSPRRLFLGTITGMVLFQWSTLGLLRNALVLSGGGRSGLEDSLDDLTALCGRKSSFVEDEFSSGSSDDVRSFGSGSFGSRSFGSRSFGSGSFGSGSFGSGSFGSGSFGSGSFGGGSFGRSGKQNRKSLRPLYTPKSSSQQDYLDLLEDDRKSLVFALGPAGSGKTLFACMQAVHALRRGAIERIVITRPLVSVEEEQIGFLPGNMVSKMDPWTRPMIDLFREFYSMADVQNMIRNGVIEIAPLAFMRGRTFHRTFVIADEMQNSSPSQMMMLTTRLGMESKMVITGDMQQSDRDRSVENGLVDFLRRLEAMHGGREMMGPMGVVQLSSRDVFRSELVVRVLEVYAFDPKAETCSGNNCDLAFDDDDDDDDYVMTEDRVSLV